MQVHEDPDAVQLRAALRGGCEKAWTAVYEQYTPSLISYGLATCSHRPAYDVESIVGAVWLSTWSRRHQLDENILRPFRFHAYLKLAVLNRIRDQSRRHTFRQEYPMASMKAALGYGTSLGDDEDFTTLIEILGGTVQSVLDPAEVFASLETSEEVREILRDMQDGPFGNELRARVLLLVHGHGLTYHDTQTKLALTHAGVKSRLFRARRTFQRLWIEKHGALA